MCSGFVKYPQTFSTGAFTVLSTVTTVLSFVSIVFVFDDVISFTMQTSDNSTKYLLCENDNHEGYLRHRRLFLEEKFGNINLIFEAICVPVQYRTERTSE